MSYNYRYLGRTRPTQNETSARRTSASCILAFPIYLILLTSSVAFPGEWGIGTLPTTPLAKLCNDLKRRLNSATEICARDALETFPEFESPPWESLDARQHIDLVAKLLKYGAQPRYLFTHPSTDLEPARQRAREFIDRGGRLQVWRTRLLSFFDSDSQSPAPPGDQVVVLLSSAPGSDSLRSSCAGNSVVSQNTQTFIVLPDLSGPDPAVTPGIASLLKDHRPVIYHGQTLLIGSDWWFTDNKKLRDGRISIFNNYGPAGLSGGDCSLGFDPERASHKQGH